MRLSIINFAFYDEKQEQEGGDYWNFANAGLSEIDNLDEAIDCIKYLSKNSGRHFILSYV